MYLLNKLIQLREKAHPDHEKPFLEHLDDLRTMLLRIVVTLIISMVVCFSFQKSLMEVLRLPVEKVWSTQQAAKLPQSKDQAPRPLDIETWEQAKAAAHAAASLDPAQRQLFYQALGNENLVFHAQAATLLRATLALPANQRDAFLAGLQVSDELKRQVKALVLTGPNVESDSRGNLKLMSALKPTETFMLSMKLSFFAGIILAFPLLLMFVLQFVLPGLHAHEKRVMWPAMAIGFGLFLCGVLFAYYAVLPRALLFFYEWSGSLGVSNDWRIGEYISFATQFTLLFGLSFELPVVVMVFVKLGLLTYETMSRTRSYAIVAIFVAAAILTPTPDVFTLTLMAAPMIILYEICIWLAWFDRRKNRLLEEQEARERAESLPALTEAAPFASDPAKEPAPEPASSGDDGWTGQAPVFDEASLDAIPPDASGESPPEAAAMLDCPADTGLEIRREPPLGPPVETPSPAATPPGPPVDVFLDTPPAALLESPPAPEPTPDEPDGNRSS